MAKSVPVAAPRPFEHAQGQPATATVRALFAAMVVAATALVVALAVAGTETWTPWTIASLALLVPVTAWIAGGAATALLGVMLPPAPVTKLPFGWRPSSRTAILIMVCGETPAPVAARAAALRRALDRLGLHGSVRISVLSDTSGKDAVRAERRAFAPLMEAGLLRYRRRLRNTGRKPGNIAEWLETRGRGYDFMLVMDADSRMSAGRIARLIHRMEQTPGLGLLQAGIAQTGTDTRFARSQRLAARLMGPSFVAGLAAWSGRTSNYWGHNALIRVRAFHDAAAYLPVLPGAAPMGGPVLSHDVVEAAFLRRAGWAVAFDPDTAGSAEEPPATLEEFHRRDRRWCQGNLQHLRLLTAPGLHPLSRAHMAAGVLGYAVAPLWLALLLLAATGHAPVTSVWPAVAVAVLLLTPKACGLWRLHRRGHPRRNRLLWRAALAELCVSALIAPLVMLRQTLAIGAVALGRDCGWKTRGRVRALPAGWLEAVTGAALAALVFAIDPEALAWMMPVLGPLLIAPWLVRWLARPVVTA
ncbi:glucans biosynthesis glucosyltransferase MdoH [Citreimonas sp.]|uniref:glucans biosynthesis glucosyltransferase MdoH n=1 Tax=Citreimonas sp. TaxID=3036715 RepID=UPI0035C86638